MTVPLTEPRSMVMSIVQGPPFSQFPRRYEASVAGVMTSSGTSLPRYLPPCRATVANSGYRPVLTVPLRWANGGFGAHPGGGVRRTGRGDVRGGAGVGGGPCRGQAGPVHRRRAGRREVQAGGRDRRR